MPTYNLIEYSDNYFSTSGSLWHFGRDEIINNADVTNDNNAPSFKYKANLIGNTEANGTQNRVKIAVSLKYLSNFWRSLEIKKFIGNKNIKANIFRVQANNSIMCGYFCNGFIDFMLAGQTLTDYTNMFSPYDFNKNDSIILSYLKDA